MPGKITAYADKYLAASSRGGVTRSLSAIAVRKAAAAQLQPAVSKWVAQ